MRMKPFNLCIRQKIYNVFSAVMSNAFLNTDNFGHFLLQNRKCKSTFCITSFLFSCIYQHLFSVGEAGEII